MKRGKMWAKSTNGPDWTDLEVAMRAVGSLSDGVVSLTILPLGTGATGGLRIAIAFSPGGLDVEGGEELFLSESQWPCPEGCTFEGHVFAGILGLDAHLEMRGRGGKKDK